MEEDLETIEDLRKLAGGGESLVQLEVQQIVDRLREQFQERYGRAPMSADHKVWQDFDEETGCDVWECSCGAAGSAPEGRGDQASDKHIKPGETRVDTTRRP